MPGMDDIAYVTEKTISAGPHNRPDRPDRTVVETVDNLKTRLVAAVSAADRLATMLGVGLIDQTDTPPDRPGLIADLGELLSLAQRVEVTLASLCHEVHGRGEVVRGDDPPAAMQTVVASANTELQSAVHHVRDLLVSLTRDEEYALPQSNAPDGASVAELLDYTESLVIALCTLLGVLASRLGDLPGDASGTVNWSAA